MEVNHKQLKYLISEFRTVGKPLFIKGATGVGKSEAVLLDSKEYATKIGRVWKAWTDLTIQDRKNLLNDDELAKIHLFVDVRTALLEPTDLMGMPSLNGSFVEWKPTLLFKILSMPSVSATVFFDEFNLGSRMVQNSCYQIILDKAIGETRLGKDVFIIAAGNRAEDKAYIIETPAPLLNRFGHCVLKCPTVEEWVTYNMNSKYPEPRLCAFLKFKPEYIHGFKPDLKEEAFSSPRQLQDVAQMICDKDEKKHLDIISMVAKSKCGEAFGMEFVAFLKMSIKVNVDDILNNPEKASEIKELDLKYSLISGVAHKVKQNFKKYFTPALKVCDNIEEEFGIFLLSMIKELVGRNKFTQSLLNSELWVTKLAEKYRDLMED